MNDPSSRSRGLLDAARSARPTYAARERMSVALAARIGVVAIGAPPQPGPVAPAPAPPVIAPPIIPAPLASGAAAMSTAKAIVLGAVLGVVSVGAAAVWPDSPQLSPSTTHSMAEPSSSVARAVESAAESVAPSTPLVEAPPPARIAEVATPPVPETPRVAEVPVIARDRARPPRAVASVEALAARESADQHTDPRAPARKDTLSPPLGTISLGEETASLGEAQRSLKQGEWARAIAVLDALAARHPTGVLREERLAARVFALCAAGRVEEAREAGQRFLAELPMSVQADRVRASCALSPGNPR